MPDRPAATSRPHGAPATKTPITHPPILQWWIEAQRGCAREPNVPLSAPVARSGNEAVAAGLGTDRHRRGHDCGRGPAEPPDLGGTTRLISNLIVLVAAAGMIVVVIAAARDLPQGALVPYAVSVGTGVIATTASLLLVHSVDRAAGGLAVFAASLLLATRGHPVRLADASFFLDELGVEPPSAQLTRQDTRRVQRRFIVYVLLLMPLVFVFL
jgi:hypothetical protein